MPMKRVCRQWRPVLGRARAWRSGTRIDSPFNRGGSHPVVQGRARLRSSAPQNDVVRRDGDCGPCRECAARRRTRRRSRRRGGRRVAARRLDLGDADRGLAGSSASRSITSVPGYARLTSTVKGGSPFTPAVGDEQTEVQISLLKCPRPSSPRRRRGCPGPTATAAGSRIGGAARGRPGIARRPRWSAARRPARPTR